MNTDGSSTLKTKKAKAGNAIRDWEGKWICGFSSLLGDCSAAELWGLILGQRIAWRKGYSNLLVERDSLVLVDGLANQAEGFSKHHNLRVVC